MGVSTDAIMCFGVDFDEELPKFLKDLPEDSQDIETYLMEKAGLKYPDWKSEKEVKLFSKERDALVEACPVELIYHCHGDCLMYILAMRGSEIRAHRGQPEYFMPRQLRVYETESKIHRMRDFFKEVDIEFQYPRWMLSSIWW